MVTEIKEIRKAIFPMAGLGTRFLPLSKVVNKEFLPLADRPVIDYLIEEAVRAEIKKIIFVISPGKEEISEYFKGKPKIEKALKEKKREDLLRELERIQELAKKISFSFVIQREPLGDGQAILMAENMVNNEPIAVFFSDDIIDSQIPCLSQLSQIFKTSQAPVIALKRVPPDRLLFYGVVGVEKIAHRLYKIKKIVEKPLEGTAPSDLAIVGRFIITPEVFNYLQKTPPGKNKEILISQALAKMVKDGKIIYGYEVEGEWLECGNKLGWLKAHLYLSLKHPEYGPKLKKYLKEII
jgi:UTP--glucose-1-phosphate uridylyltransferase